MDAKTQVVLTGPAKIDGAWHKAGEMPLVDAVTLQQLQEAGVIPLEVAEELLPVMTLEPGTELIFTQAEFDAAVEAKAKEMAGAAFNGALNELEKEASALVASVDELEAEKAAALARAEKAEKAHADYIAQAQADVDRLQARGRELEATIAKLTPPPEPKAEKKPKGG